MEVRKTNTGSKKANSMTFNIAEVFSKLVFTLFGVYVWEMSMTADFEWSLMTGRRRFRWPLVSIEIRCFLELCFC